MMTNTLRLIAVIIATACLLEALVSCKNVEQTVSPVPGVAQDRPVERFEFRSESELEQLISDLDYKPEDWQAGIREVPRLYITDIPARWGDKSSKELDVATKKQVFFLFLGPLILHSNELIQTNRDRVASIIEMLRAGATVSAEDQTFLSEIAETYKVTESKTELITDRSLQDKLLRRVDTVPPSLVLAQAAEESGWGTSRFAVEGNALFGIWTWGDKGITPLQQRSVLGNYKIASYETPLQSVIAYMHNLNTHQAYQELRARRAELRKTGAKVTGWDLAKTLTKYSERGQAYVESLQSLIKGNRLQPADDAFLGNGPTILLIPVGEDANKMASL
ncbi:MAG: glucosaminidase domain-containing protein [Desulfuromonadales bacterium]